jgi:hypothetical protein
MLTFPILKTGAVAQYPMILSEAFGNEVLQFVGGDEQRFRSSPGSLRSWTIQLELLDETELAQVDAFFAAASGSFGVFDFPDPVSGTVISNCFVQSDNLTEDFIGEFRAGTVLVIHQGRA